MKPNHKCDPARMDLLYIRQQFICTTFKFDAYVYGAAKNSCIKYSFNNWVNGPGEDLYKNYSLVLVDENKDVIYKFKTYNKSFAASNEKVNALSSNGDGFVAYVPKKYSDKDLA